MSDAPTHARSGRVQPAGGSGPEALTATDLVAWADGRLLRDSLRPIHGAAVDSRLVRPGELFVALPGERTDGHRFLREAVMAGAAALLVASEPDAATMGALGDVTIVAVDDPLAALQRLAGAWRQRFRPLVVGVTGSIAKTSTKEAVAAVLGGRGRTLRSEGNRNNEVGLPLTLLRLDRSDVNAVLEMGMYAAGEIAQLAALAEPQIGVVTAVLGVHLSRIGTIDAVENAKAELVEALPQDGTAILNADDFRVRRMAARTPAGTMTYGFAADADVGAERVRSAGTAGMRFVLRLSLNAGTRRLPAAIPGLGRLSVHNALAGAAVGVAAGMSAESIVAALAGGWGAPHRVQLVPAGEATLIDDTYNASPASVVAALELLGGLPGRHVAVLGEMLELGDAAAAGHHDVGRAAAGICDLLVTVGPGASGIAAGARAGGMAPSLVVEVPDRAAGVEELRRRIRAGDMVLIKGSRGVELDLLVDELRTDRP
ncbi:MAG: UDP-N-acetylmuramoyl-tripeptide--D-alanyl-D-alanine ligase [Chloroflexi bacterium]|nr:UDP-N-acetylmuramoyl-tripeptide--D-alanyl-D-alanine ligase [Chloroflexota bacterium]